MKKNNLLPADKDPRNPSYSFKNLYNEDVENSFEFNSYIKSKKINKIYTGSLWAEGPAYIPHLKTLVWSDIPNNRMLKLINNQISESKKPSNFCNGNTIDNEENFNFMLSWRSLFI